MAEQNPPLRFLRVETTTSPSWVAWREIQVYPTELRADALGFDPDPPAPA